MSIRQFGIITVVVALLILFSSVYRVGAAPPEPEKESTALPGSTPGPAMDIRTRLQQDQLSGVEPFQLGGRVLRETSSLPGVNAELSELVPGPAVTIRTKLQTFQTSGLELSQSEGRLIQESPLLSKNEEAPIGALAQQTFNASADATVLQGYPTQNLGNTIDMWAGYDDSLTPDGRIVRSLIKFNIAGLPANQAITKATLRVRLVNSWDYPNRNRTVTTYRIIADWSESSVTWNNKPGYGGSYGSKSIGEDDWGWHEFDVTALVSAWYGGTYTNYGIMLRGPEVSGSDSSWRGFSTREGSFTPQLVIEYTTDENCPDAFESDNTFTTAKSIAVNGTAQTHNFHLAGDEDWVKFTMTAGKVYTITTSNLGVSNDTYMYLYDTNGTTILAQDDDSGPGFGSQIVWPATGNGTYYVRVRHLLNAGGCAGYNYDLAVTEGTAQLVAPIPLTAVPFSQTQILLSWPDPNTIESGYKIERSPNAPISWTQVATVGANITTYLNSGLTCNTTYYYRVRAYNASGDSAYSNTANATPPCPPLAPTNLTATSVSTTQINLTWQDNSTDETGFQIERSPNNVTWAQIASVGLNVTNYADTGLTCGSTYFYRVRAYNAGGNSPHSNTDDATTDACTGSDSTDIYLPLIMRNFAPPPPPPPGSKPVDGHWTGTTNRSQPMSFDVSSGGTILNNFKLKTTYSVDGCSGTTEVTASGPGFAITNNQFSHSGGTFSFSGQFNSPTTASGTYSFINYPGCGGFSQSGTWTAQLP